MKKILNTIAVLSIALGTQAAVIKLGWIDTNPPGEIKEYIIHASDDPVSGPIAAGSTIQFNTGTNYFRKEGTNISFTLEEVPTGRKFFAVEAVSVSGISSDVSTNVLAFVPAKVEGVTIKVNN